VPDMAIGIATIAGKGIERVHDTSIRTALKEAYESSAALSVSKVAQDVLDRFATANWPVEVLAPFLSSWRSTHGTALFVSGLVVRLQREARDSSAVARPIFFEAAAEMSEIIAEDTGIDDTPHNELFTRFANKLVGDDRWQLSHYSTPASLDFRDYVKRGRLVGPTEEAILMTAASESWNSAEYSYFETSLRRWMREVLGYNEDTLEDTIAYVSHHSGEVELGHFLHALNAWSLYCEAKEEPVDPLKVKLAFESYFEHLRRPFEGLKKLLDTC
jgi:hypothetical protein